MPVYAIADNIISPIGITTKQNFASLLDGISGIRRHELDSVHTDPFYASLFVPTANGEHSDGYTRFERILIHSISTALRESHADITSPQTGIVIATTKGNISLLEGRKEASQKLPLHYSAHLIARHFGNPNDPIVVSNACISGLTALITGKRLIESGKYSQVVVAGADLVSRFVFSGFNAFQAISNEACKPYDADRKGVTLGEAAATLILSSRGRGDIRLAGTGASNDANHISGPSRTGVELSMAMKHAIETAGIQSKQVGYISAHGTATIYNDEMEAKAIHLSGLQDTPVNSLKGYYGHTLGAAGILESVIAIQSMKNNILLPTRGFANPGVSQKIEVIDSLVKTTVNHCLKTASGFGGCNAAILYSN